MKIFKNTLTDISDACSEYKIRFAITRFDSFKKSLPSDIDLLITGTDFLKTINVFNKEGYKSFSHDQALGGRIKGMQINLVKPRRIKIDLHQAFTWRKSKYFDLKLIWDNLQPTKIEGININLPKTDIDAFIVLVNIIFEKTYLNENEFSYIKRMSKDIFDNQIFGDQALRFGWGNSFEKFKSWFKKSQNRKDYPVFLPFNLIIYSYWEKFIFDFKIDVISLLYYLFFRLRFLLNKQLPYE